MNIAEASAFRALVARVDSLEREVKDLTRRADDQSKAHRILADQMESKKLKKGEAA
jgi:hypothetical protein